MCCVRGCWGSTLAKSPGCWRNVVAGPLGDTVFSVTSWLSEKKWFHEQQNHEVCQRTVQEGIKRCGIIARKEEVGEMGNNEVLCSPFVSSNCPFAVIQIERGHFRLHCNKYKSIVFHNYPLWLPASERSATVSFKVNLKVNQSCTGGKAQSSYYSISFYLPV